MEVVAVKLVEVVSLLEVPSSEELFRLEHLSLADLEEVEMV